MKTTASAVTICSCIALLSFSALCVSGIWFVRSANGVVAALPGRVDARAEAIEKDLTGQLSAAIVDANNRLKESLTIVDQRSEQALKTLDTGTAALIEAGSGAMTVADKAETDLNARLMDTNKILDGQLANTNKTLADTAKPITDSAQQINAVLPDFLDCQYDETGIGNKNCLYVRYGDLSSSLDRTLSAVAKAAPAMANDVDRIAASSAGVAASADAIGKEVAIAAHRFNQPQTKMQAFRSWLLTLARIYGAI